MPPAGFFIDANLLVLLVVGNVDSGLILGHRRLAGYAVDDYALLRDQLGRVRQTFVMPNTLTEASNLLAQHREPQRSRFLEELRSIIETGEEIVVASLDASQNDAFLKLGLTDAALLERVSAETPVLTVDVGLYLAALAKGEEAAVNFNHLRAL